VKKVNKPRREKIAPIEEKKLTVATGSSGYSIIAGFVEPTEEGGNP
jgi:hypothetical protein